MRRPLTIFLLVSSYCGPALAAEGSSPFDFFNERCLSSGPDFERTVTFSKGQDWPALAVDMSLNLTPVENPLALEGWVVSPGDGTPFEALVVSRGNVGQRPVEGCTAAFSGIDATAFERQLVERTGAKASGEERGQDRIHKFYTASVGGRDEALTLSIPVYPNGADEVVASVVAEQQFEN
ncbi:hypothetical protein [Rhizobium binxianense]